METLIIIANAIALVAKWHAGSARGREGLSRGYDGSNTVYGPL